MTTPLAPLPINWQKKFAREHDIPGANCGQVLKQFAESSNIDTFSLDGRIPGTRQCIRESYTMGKFQPKHPPYSSKYLEEEGGRRAVPWNSLCSIHPSITNTKLEKGEITVTGRKLPLKDLSGRSSW